VRYLSSDAQDIYQKLLKAGFTDADIKDQIKEKTKEFQGFITREGALFLIAKDNGINSSNLSLDPDLRMTFQEEIDYDEFAIPISEVRVGMSNIVLLGRIMKIFKVREFLRKDGTPGIVGSFLVSDGNSNIKVVLWGEKAKITQSEYFQPNELIRIIGGYSKEGLEKKPEIHIGRKGKIILAPEDINPKLIPPKVAINEDNYITKSESSFGLNILDLQEKEGVLQNINGLVGKIEFKEIDKKNGEKTFLLKFPLMDEMSSINFVAWGMNAITCLKAIEEGTSISLSKVMVKFNQYSGEKEISFIKSSEVETI